MESSSIRSAHVGDVRGLDVRAEAPDGRQTERLVRVLGAHTALDRVPVHADVRLLVQQAVTCESEHSAGMFTCSQWGSPVYTMYRRVVYENFDKGA